MRKEAAAMKIQKNLRRSLARKSYTRLWSAVLVLQTGLRAMSARNEYRLGRQTKAAIAIQVYLTSDILGGDTSLAIMFLTVY